MSMRTVWVPIEGDGYDVWWHPKGCYEILPGKVSPGNLKLQIPWQSDFSDIRDLSGKRTHAHTYTRIRVDEKYLDAKNVPHFEEWYAEDAPEVPESDKLINRMMREAANAWDGKADAFFDSIPNISTGSVERKEMAVELLEQAGYRGLSAEKKLEIAERLNLTEVEVGDIGGARP